MPELCNGLNTSVAAEGELHAIIGSLSEWEDVGVFTWDWHGTIYVRINMTENSGGSSVAKSLIASNMAGNKVQGNMQTEIAKGEFMGMGKGTVTVTPFQSTEDTRTAEYYTYCS